MIAASILRDDFARIEQALRVERVLDRAHQGKFDFRFVLPHFRDQILADSVLGAESAPKLRGYAISQPVLPLLIFSINSAFLMRATAILRSLIGP